MTLLWFVPGVLVFGFSLLLFAPPAWLLRWIQRRSGVVFHWDAPRPILYLTIDDAPSPFSHHILNALDECNQSKALFFVIGRLALNHPSVLKRILAEGHQVGNHDLDNRVTAAPWHPHVADFNAVKQILVKAAAAAAAPQQLTSWLRPGCGFYTTKVLEAAAATQHRVLLGDVYGHDCQFVWFPRFLQWFYLWRIRSSDGNVVILHDGTERRARNTAAVIKLLFRNGYSFRLLPTNPSILA